MILAVPDVLAVPVGLQAVEAIGQHLLGLASRRPGQAGAGPALVVVQVSVRHGEMQHRVGQHVGSVLVGSGIAARVPGGEVELHGSPHLAGGGQVGVEVVDPGQLVYDRLE